MAITASICLLKELLHLLPVLNAHLQDEPSPVDRHDPSNDVHGCQHLNKTNDELRLTPFVWVADARADHSASSRQDDIQDEADIGPDTTETGQ